MAHQSEPDLPSDLSCLKNVYALLRCPICFDFFSISMMTKCSHNFCSLCIRKYLSYKLQCPVCNTPATEQDLRNNRLLDDLVSNFQAASQQLSKANFDTPPISPKTPASAVKLRTPVEKGQKCASSLLSHFFQKRPKTSPAKETHPDSPVVECVQRGRRRAARARNANEADLHSEAAQLPAVVKEEPMDVEEASAQGLTPVKQEDAGSAGVGVGPETAHSSSLSQDTMPVIKVECPVCSVAVSQQFINKHLDMCLGSGEKKESLRSSFGNRRRPMGKLVYNLLSLQELKRKLKECHLSTQGPRDQLIKRHREFVHRYNSQCDSLNPQSAEEIAKELEANEKIRNQLQGKTKPVMVFSKNQSEEEIDAMHSNYRKQNSSDFSRLVAQVRGRLETTRRARVTQEVAVDGQDAPNAHSADHIAESKGCLARKAEDSESDEKPSARAIALSPSPTRSDVSISSSLSDIFAPEPARDLEERERTSVKKRRSTSRDGNAASPFVRGKRLRKS